MLKYRESDGTPDPIPTYSITRDFDWSDTENNRLLFEMTAKYGTPYFSNYVNSDMEPSDVRSMAILGTQDVIYSDKFGRISKNEIRHLVKNWIKSPDREYKMLMNGKFVPVIDMFEVPYKEYDSYVSISLANGQTQSFSYDHRTPVVRDGKVIEVLSQDVVPGDELLLARNAYDNPGVGTYESGRILGYYIAEGWVSHNGTEIVFAINNQRKDIVDNIKNYFSDIGCLVRAEEDAEKHIYKVHVYGKSAVGFVSDYVSGQTAKTKRLTINTWNTSSQFRTGIYDGYFETDGCKNGKNYAHTTNKKLCEDLIVLGASIGKYFKMSVNDKNTRYFKEDKSDLEHFTSYRLDVFKPAEQSDEYYSVKVINVSELDASRINTVYNFTVDTNDHLYELPNGIITHQCCRLRLDLRELRRKSGGYFGSGESTGSIGVVTINMPRLAYLSETEADFYARLDHLMDVSARSLKVKRDVITKFLDNGLYPYTRRYLGTFNNHFSTIGLVGMNEACLNAKWIKADMTSPKSQAFTKDVLNHMRERLSDYQEEYGDLYNLEATPAESTAFRFAKHDKEQFPDIITAAKTCDETPYYTNSSHLPVWFTDDIFAALDIQDDLQTLYTSGTVFHGFLGEKLPNWQSAANLVRKIAENYKLPYYTLSPTYSVCKAHGYLSGEQKTCPICGEKTEVYSRITGYYRPVQNWNDGKTQEYKHRKEYNIATSVLHKAEAGCSPEGCSFDGQNSSEPQKSSEIILIATPTCPNCKVAASLLDKQGIAYEKLFAMEHKDLVDKYGVKQAPTLVIINDNGFTKYTGVSEIKKYLQV